MGLCVILIGLGLVPLSPALLGRLRRSPRAARRSLAAWVAFPLLWLCFNLSCAAMFGVGHLRLWFAPGPTPATLAALLVLEPIGGWLSYRVAFARD